MKHMVKSVKFLLLSVLLMCSACGVQQEEPPKPGSSDAVSEWRGIGMEMEHEEYSAAGETEIRAAVNNDSDFWLGHGEEWHLEKYDEENGFVVYPNEPEPPMVFASIWTITPPGGTETYFVDLSYYGGRLQPGRYRLVAGPFILEDEDLQPTANPEGDDRCILYAEFLITND